MNVKAYQIVEFVNDREDNKISVDCVPSKWVTYDQNLRSCVCKFMPPPYNTKVRLKLDSFVLSKSEAPESWPSYPVYLRGEAETLKEAKQKMHKIIHKTQSYAYFIDNDDHAKKRSARSTKFFQGKTEMSHQETIEKIMYDDNKIEESREDSSSTSSSDQSEESIKNKSLMKNKKSLNTCKNKYVDVEQNIKMNISANTMSTKAHISTKKSNLKDDATKSSSNNFSQPSTSTDLNNTAGIPNQNIQHIENYQDATFPKEILLLHKAVKSLTIEISMQSEQIRQLKNSIEQTLKIKVDPMTVEKFINKHNVILKLSNLTALKNFEEKLSEDGEFLSDFKACLKHLIEENMYKTVLTVLKKFMHRELAIQCTAVRRSKEKYVMKDTIFYKVLFDLICGNCTGENNKPITEKDFYKALGSIFNNAKDWDNQRNVRRLIATKAANEND